MMFSTLLSREAVILFVATVAVTLSSQEVRVIPGVDGTLFRLAYERNGLPYYLSSRFGEIEAFPDSLFDPTNGQFIFELPIVGDTIRIESYLSYGGGTSSQGFLNVAKYGDQPLSLGSYSDSTSFQLERVGAGSELKYHIRAMNSEDTLVTPSRSAPFKFYRSGRYPTEPRAEFILERMSLNESYAGRPDHTPQIIKMIQNGEFGNKTEAYENLLDIMAHGGKEIFDVGHSIKQYVGPSSSLFLRLPSQVQLLLSGDPLVLNYTDSNGNSYPMKYNYSSTLPDNVQPYTFNYTNGLWAITYANSHQLLVYGETPYNLIEVFGDTKNHEFQLRLKDGQFGIYSSKKQKNVFYALGINSVEPFYFTESNMVDYKFIFSVEKYSQP